MRHVVIAGNWKSHKTLREAKDWINKFAVYKSKLTIPADFQILLFAPFTLLGFLKEQINLLSLPLAVGAENVSPFTEGAYTGEVNAKQVKEFASWVIVGHSERRINFHETDELLAQKVKHAKEFDLKVIYCVQNAKTPIPPNVDIVGYEPPWAISAVSHGKTQTPLEANLVCQKIKENAQGRVIIYGGSVTPGNVASFLGQEYIEGVLVGGSSLAPGKFTQIIERAIKAN